MASACVTAGGVACMPALPAVLLGENPTDPSLKPKLPRTVPAGVRKARM